MNVLALLQQLQDGPQNVAGDDMDFMMPQGQFQKPGMKTEKDLEEFMRNQYPKQSIDPNISGLNDTPEQKQADRSRRKFLRRNGVDGDYDFQGQKDSPDLPSRNDYRYLNMFGGDKVSEDFVNRFGESRLNPKRADPNFIPLPAEKPEEWNEEPDEDILPGIPKGGIQGIPKEGLDGMPPEQLKELYLFQKKQRGEPLTDEEQLQQLEFDMNNAKR